MSLKKAGLVNVLMLLFMVVTSCSKGDDNVVDPETTPTSKLPTLKLTASTKDSFVNEEVSFKVVDEKGNVVTDAKLFVNEQALNTASFSSKTAASFKVYAQKAGFKTSNTVEIRFIEKDDVDAVVTGKWKFIPSTLAAIFEFNKDMSFTYTQAGEVKRGTYSVKGNRVQMTLVEGDTKDEDYGVINIAKFTANLLDVEVIVKDGFKTGKTGQLERVIEEDPGNGNGDDDDDDNGNVTINLAMFYGEWRGYEDGEMDYSIKMKFKSDKMEAEAKNMGKYNPILYLVDDLRYYDLHNSSTLILTGRRTAIVYYFKVASYNDREIVGTLYLDSMVPSNGVKLTLKKK
ncbi:hypothetical protein [Myroides fluvii]|uniref:hypothetical protein n=1 Tax=Myroides fluvii TaxID=2572594 RepID=UPI00131B5B82|nr:hypothetical protein [Myroides fluvii]